MNALGSFALAFLLNVIGFMTREIDPPRPLDSPLVEFRRWLLWPGSLFWAVAFCVIYFARRGLAP